MNCLGDARARFDRFTVLMHKGISSLHTHGFRATARKIRPKLRPVPVPEDQRPWYPEPSGTAVDSVPYDEQPEITIVVPVFNHWRATRECLRALAAAPPSRSIEVVLVDDGSTDETQREAKKIHGLRYVRRTSNDGFIAACSDGAATARGEFVAFLNNDTTPQPGWLDALADTLDGHPDAGLVGAQLLDARGRVQEAGGIVFDDGTAVNYGRGYAPNDPRVSFLREVDYCSGAAILIQRRLFERLGGFDRRYLPAYYEDTDLAFAVRAAGLRVIYQPRARVVHAEGTSAGTDTRHGVKAYQLRNQTVFAQKWASILQQQPSPGDDVDVAATRRATPTVLVIDGQTPHPEFDSGSMRLVNAMRLLCQEGAHVVFWPIDRAYDGEATRVLQSLGIETLYAPYAASIGSLLRARGSHIDTIVACRYHVAREVLPMARKLAPDAKVVFDSVDLHFLREGRQAELTGDASLRRLAARTRRLELDVVARSDATLVVSPAEADVLKAAVPGAQVHVLSNIHDVAGRGPGFTARTDIVFVGGFRHLPNADGVRWFLSEVFPHVRSRLPNVRFHCIGSGPPEDILALGSTSGVTIHGHVPELHPFMDKVRVSVAPLRFGAGVKGKINMSLAHGQPVVTTSVGVEGMHLQHEVDVMVADDPLGFADCVVRLYEDEDLWNKLAANGLMNVERHFSMEVAGDIVRRVLLAP